ncbi:excalibur calcium-binding domain-containing protein [Brevundimonas sp. NPDC092305]|uniref:excalibur calcium-binding domain-containing protein n=1 Tax=Brevundimonas sp. NPDC092305 TaxID=3363957 RepID=UPI0038260C21
MPRLATFAAALAVLAVPALTAAHPGGLDKNGCHNDRKNGGYHCHRADRAGGSRPQPLLTRPRSEAFANCSEARAAGAAPVRRGDPGYGPHLDRDRDGVGCER